MGSRFTVKVVLPDGTPAPGAQIMGINNDAWSDKHREWPATAGLDGTHTWPSLDDGTMGDRYTFQVKHTDLQGRKWEAESSHRVKGEHTLTIVLHPS